MSLKQLPPAFGLGIPGIPDLEPFLAIRPVLRFRHDPLQVLIAREAEELYAVDLDVLGVQYGGGGVAPPAIGRLSSVPDRR